MRAGDKITISGTIEYVGTAYLWVRTDGGVIHQFSLSAALSDQSVVVERVLPPEPTKLGTLVRLTRDDVVLYAIHDGDKNADCRWNILPGGGNSVYNSWEEIHENYDSVEVVFEPAS